MSPTPAWRIGWPGLALMLAVIVGLLLLYATPINGEVHAVIGGIRTYNDSPLGAVDVFSYRPLPYRLVIGLFHSAASIVGEPGDLSYELAVRSCGLGIAVGAGASLALGLRSRLPDVALAAGAAAGISLGLAPTFDFLQPEWLSAAAVVTAVGVALSTKTDAMAGATAGFLILFAFAAKLATAPLSLLAILAILVIDQRRAIAASIGAAGWGIAWLAMLVALPIERQWTLDMAGLTANAPWRVGISASYIGIMAQAIASKAIVAPVILLAPAAAVTLAVLARPKKRLRVLGLITVGLFLAMAPLLVQGTQYMYQLAMLPVACAVLVGLALGRALFQGVPAAWVLGASLVVVVIGFGIALNLDGPVRAASAGLVVALAAAATITFGVAVLLVRWRTGRGEGHRPTAVVLVSAALVCSMLPALLPSAGWAYDPDVLTLTNARWTQMLDLKHANAARLTAAIGADAPVLYLATGETAYFMGNPTTCRYAIPWFLRLGTHLDFVRDLETYRDNLACIVQTEADYALVEARWLYFGPFTDDIRGRLHERYSCDASAAIVVGAVYACPRR